MTKRPTLAAALHQSVTPQATHQNSDEAQTQTLTKISSTESSVPPSRRGKKTIGGHFDPAVSRQLKQIAIDHDKSIQSLLAEALNDLFLKYGKSPIA